MRRDTLQFAHQDSDDLSPFGYFDRKQLFRGHHIRQVIAERIEIIHAVGNDDALLVFFILEQLFHTGVQITDVGNSFYDQLAVQPQIKPQNAVHGRVLRSH